MKNYVYKVENKYSKPIVGIISSDSYEQAVSELKEWYSEKLGIPEDEIKLKLK